jgi:hypothetical protein
MALMCVPGFTSESRKTGVVEVVAVQTTSASETASFAVDATSMRGGIGGPASAISSRNFSAARLRVSNTRTRSIGRTVETAWS